jgi:hypothetical protein
MFGRDAERYDGGTGEGEAMTEAEWKVPHDPQSMIRYLIGCEAPRVQDVEAFPDSRGSERKLRLFACACYHRVRDRMPNALADRVVAVAERYADGDETPEEFIRASEAVRHQSNMLEERWRASRGAERALLTPLHESLALAGVVTWDMAQKAAYYASSNSYLACSGLPSDDDPRWQNAHSAQEKVEKRAQTQILRDIFGNPFRPVAFDPAWRSSTAVALATGIYADRAFDRLPILADALQDAGCEDADVLGHCRGPGPHVRGCWVVDLVLGKE